LVSISLHLAPLDKLGWKALKEVGRLNEAAGCVSDSNATHGPSASMTEITKAIETARAKMNQ
jgi:hypothetical protein